MRLLTFHFLVFPTPVHALTPTDIATVYTLGIPDSNRYIAKKKKKAQIYVSNTEE